MLFDRGWGTPDGPARLFRAPLGQASLRSGEDAAQYWQTLRDWHRRGHHLAGYLDYEAALAIEPGLGTADASGDVTAWFGAFGEPQLLSEEALAGWLGEADAAWVGAPQPEIAFDAYAARHAAVQHHIAAGDFYQANLTFAASVGVEGPLGSAFAGLRRRAEARYGALIANDQRHVLSLSPELFFALDASGELLARPMKGTARRGASSGDDVARRDALAADPKQRAENLMIVDLLRNDLSRVAAPGSVAVPRLFAVETYPTLHQMVSDIRAELREGCDVFDVIAALFPCGSITGAPKRSAMERLRAIEGAPRGPYTGSIGHIAPDGSACFNVAIRTLTLPAGPRGLRGRRRRATLGLGSGIVADSRAAAEWDECRAKGAFVASAGTFDLIETMAFDPERGIARLDAHLARLSASAHALEFRFDRHALRNLLQHATFRLRDVAQVRVRLGRSGALAVEVRAMPQTPDRPLRVALVPRPGVSEDVRFAHKTSDRRPHRAALAAAGTGADEVVMLDTDGALTEGSWTSLFVERDGALLTPPLSRGILPGVLRGELIAQGRAREAELVADDLAQGFLLGNALRGLMPAQLVGAAVAMERDAL